jgi:hypothetical protein
MSTPSRKSFSFKVFAFQAPSFSPKVLSPIPVGFTNSHQTCILLRSQHLLQRRSILDDRYWVISTFLSCSECEVLIQDGSISRLRERYCHRIYNWRVVWNERLKQLCPPIYTHEGKLWKGRNLIFSSNQ